MDYCIVLRDGSAGCIPANRLQANPSISILLIESGVGEASAGETQVRPDRWDFDLWKALGNDGWNFGQMVPFAAPERVLRGHISELTESLLDAATECGIPPNGDCNGWTKEGAGLFHVASGGGGFCPGRRARHGGLRCQAGMGQSEVLLRGTPFVYSSFG